MLTSVAKSRRIVEGVLAIVLFSAAVLKMNDLLVNASNLSGGSALGRAASGMAIDAEAMLAIWMLIGGFSPQRFYCVIGFFCVVACVALIEVVHAAPTCGCFGKFAVSPRLTAIFDLVAIALLWLTRPQSDNARNRSPLQDRLAGAAAISLLVIVGVLFLNPSKAVSAAGWDPEANLAPASWINKPFPLFGAIDGSQELKIGRWLIVFYHFDCEECRQAVPAYLRLAAMKNGDSSQTRIAFVSMPPQAPLGYDLVPKLATVRHFTLNPHRERITETPLVVSLQDGSVVGVSEGEQTMLPSDAFEAQ